VLFATTVGIVVIFYKLRKLMMNHRNEAYKDVEERLFVEVSGLMFVLVVQISIDIIYINNELISQRIGEIEYPYLKEDISHGSILLTDLDKVAETCKNF